MIQYFATRYLQNKFGCLKVGLLLLHQFFTNILIKKGRGLWPFDALATLTIYSVVRRCQFHPLQAER